MNRQVWVSLLVLCALLLPAAWSVPVRAAGTLYVKPAASGSGDCSSWADACTLQDALDVAASGDEVWVAAGTHLPTYLVDPGDPRTATFALVSGVGLYGGFAGTETTRDQRNWVSNVTVLSGDIGAPDESSDNCYHVVTGTGTDATAVLDGFTVTGANANGTDPNFAGGGMVNLPGSPTIRHVVFTGNWARTGGGMYNHFSYPLLVDVVFEGNAAESAGGMSGLGGSVYLVNVAFVGNTATGLAGGMHNSLTDATLVNVLFTGNSSGSGGGGLYNWNCDPTLVNVTFSGNTTDGSGGAIYNYGSNPAVDNSILWGNTAPSGRQIDNAGGSLPVIAYSDVQASGGSGAGWDANLGTDGGGNVDSDPLFVNADGLDGSAGTADDNLRLRLASPAIDAADNNAVPADDLDLDGDGIIAETLPLDLLGRSRFLDIDTVPDTGNGAPPVVDMGAYEAKWLVGTFLPLAVRAH